MSVLAPPELYRVGRVASALDLAHKLAEHGAPSGTVVVAEEQTAGRGSRGRAWHSPPGGLWLALIARAHPDLGLEVLSLRMGIVVAEAIESVSAATRVRLKWPNDLYVGERKVGGILCESRWQGSALQWVAVGIGVNVENPVPAAVADRAGRLADADPALELRALLAPVATRCVGALDGGRSLQEAELVAFAGRDYLHHRALREPVPGVAQGIDAAGALLIRQADGTIARARSGHVVL